MARKAVSFEEVNAAFTAVKAHMGRGAKLVPAEGKVLLVRGKSAKLYAPSTLRDNLRFIAEVLGEGETAAAAE